MEPGDLMLTKKIAAVRIHVERKMQQIKAYTILANKIDSTLFDHLHATVFVCAMLTNFEWALVAKQVDQTFLCLDIAPLV